jgi:peptidyl-prolyl cis-trans isomerase A (cyclophilin A)
MRNAVGLALLVALTGLQPAVAQDAASAPAKPKASTSTAQSGTTKKTTTTAVRQYDRALLQPALLKAKAPEEYKVKFTTTKGDFVVTVTRSWAPIGADRFYNLVRHHYYDNAAFFRVLPGFVVQFGISAYPQVSAAWKDANIKDDPVAQSNLRGNIVFATAGPNTRTTQVFVNLVDNKRLDSMGFAAFGQVSDGMSVVEALYGGYGEGAPQGAGPDQDEMEKKGKAYLDQGWPKLDSIKTATLLTPPPAATSKPAAAPATKKPQ